MDTGSIWNSFSLLMVVVDQCLRDRVLKPKTFKDRKGHLGEDRNVVYMWACLMCGI